MPVLPGVDFRRPGSLSLRWRGGGDRLLRVRIEGGRRLALVTFMGHRWKLRSDNKITPCRRVWKALRRSVRSDKPRHLFQNLRRRDQNLRNVLPAPDRAPERLQVAQELAEAGEMPASTSRPTVPTLVQAVGGKPRGLQLRPHRAESVGGAGGLRMPVVEEQHRDGRAGGLVGVVDER